MVVGFPIFIYSLADPITNEIKYIGRTYNAKSRYLQHIKEAKLSINNSSDKVNWISNLLHKGMKPVMELVDIVDDKDWEFWEKYWISQFRTWGFNLTNTHPGGLFGIISEKCRENLKKSVNRGQKKGFRHNEETKRIIKQNRAKQVITEEHKRRISESMKGKKWSKERKIKFSQVRKGIKLKKQK